MDRASYVLCALTQGNTLPILLSRYKNSFFSWTGILRATCKGRISILSHSHYGPFDQEVYSVLESLEAEGLVEIEPEYMGRWNTD